MANVDTPRGLWPRRYLNGAAWNGQARRYHCLAADTTYPIYLGALVKPHGSGSADSRGYPDVICATTTADQILGVCVGVDPLGGAGGTGRDATLYRAVSTERYIWVVDDPNVLFTIQDDAAATLTAAAVMGVADLTGFTSGSTATGYSALEISAASVTTTGDGSEDVQIMGLDDVENNSIGDHASWLVRLLNHVYTASTGY